jgi:hypothetical protein
VLTKAIDEAGHSVCRVINTDWRVTTENCKIMSEVISKAICDNDPTTVVLQFLDSSMYYVRGRMGPGSCQRRIWMENTMSKVS